MGMYPHGFGVAWFQIWETLGIWASEPVGKRVSHMGMVRCIAQHSLEIQFSINMMIERHAF